MESSNEDALKPLKVKIQTSDSIVWQGEADSVTTSNAAGRFDILRGHGNMITIIEKEPIEIRSGGGSRKFTFEKAVVAVRDGNVTIFANIG